jgi:general L-amino acid transport system ATP-binding protein
VPIWVRKIAKKDAEEIAMQYLTRVKIPEQALKYPGQLSGGQQQRVAIARSLCVTHETSFARQVANRVIFMDQGQIVEQNAVEEFLRNPQGDRTRLFLSQILH